MFGKKKKEEEGIPQYSGAGQAEARMQAAAAQTAKQPRMRIGGQETMFPHIQGSELARRTQMLKGAAGVIEREYKVISEQSDLCFEDLKKWVNALEQIKKQLEAHAQEIDKVFALLDFELEGKKQVLAYHLRNKERLKELPKEIEEEIRYQGEMEGQYEQGP